MKESAIASLRRARPVLIPFLWLSFAPLGIGWVGGRGWRLSCAIVCLAIWLAWRPWRLGVASTAERFQARATGTIGLIGFILCYVVAYYRW